MHVNPRYHYVSFASQNKLETTGVDHAIYFHLDPEEGNACRECEYTASKVRVVFACYPKPSRHTHIFTSDRSRIEIHKGSDLVAVVGAVTYVRNPPAAALRL